jgi:Acetyltransferase (GNAT) domain
MDRDRVVAIHPLYLSDGAKGTGGEILLHSGIHRHAALAFAPDLKQDDKKAVQSTAMRHIDRVAQEFDIDRVQFGIQNLAPQSLGSERVEIPSWVTDYRFFLGMHYARSGNLPVPGMTILAADQVVDLKREPSAIFAGFDVACQRALRKAEANELGCVVSILSDEVQTYYDLAKISAQRTGEELPSLGYYLDIAQRFGSDFTKLFLVHYRDRPVAGLILLAYKGSLSFFAGISHPDYLGYRVNDFIHWSAMRWAASNGYQNYRLGPWFPEVPVNWDIAKRSKFKAKFGARNLTIVQASFFRRPERYRQSGVDALGRLISELSGRTSFLD